MPSTPSASVAVIGLGHVGARRARIAAEDPEIAAVTLLDLDAERTRRIADDLTAHVGDRCRVEATPTPDSWPAWFAAHPHTFAVVSTTNRWLAPIGVAALESGAHVLVEKPMGRNATEATALAHAAHESGRTLHVGFTLRGHPAVERSLELARSGAIGRPIFARCIYGHGGRPGYDREWRCDASEAGGGSLLDQGVHAIDLIHAVFGPADRIVGAQMQTACWDTAPLEDNAFATLAWDDGCTATLHTSWTHWRNRFEWQIYGELGAIEVSGLGDEGSSYGLETLILDRRDPQRAGAPDRQVETFPGPDRSFIKDWKTFRAAAAGDGTKLPGNGIDSLAVMRAADAIYAAARTAAGNRAAQREAGPAGGLAESPSTPGTSALGAAPQDRSGQDR